MELCRKIVTKDMKQNVRSSPGRHTNWNESEIYQKREEHGVAWRMFGDGDLRFAPPPLVVIHDDVRPRGRSQP